MSSGGSVRVTSPTPLCLFPLFIRSNESIPDMLPNGCESQGYLSGQTYPSFVLLKEDKKDPSASGPLSLFVEEAR